MKAEIKALLAEVQGEIETGATPVAGLLVIWIPEADEPLAYIRAHAKAPMLVSGAVGLLKQWIDEHDAHCPGCDSECAREVIAVTQALERLGASPDERRSVN